jgi:hypothetical protein
MHDKGESNVACFSVLSRPGQRLLNGMIFGVHKFQVIDLSNSSQELDIRKIYKLPLGNV